MKYLLLLLIPFASFSQNIGAGATLGYSSRNAATIELMTAVKLSNKVTFYPVNIKAHLSRQGNTPAIFESRVLYGIGQLELYGGYGYQLASMDSKLMQSKYGGFKPGYGVILHAGKVVLIAGASGGIYSAGIGVFGSGKKRFFEASRHKNSTNNFDNFLWTCNNMIDSYLNRRRYDQPESIPDHTNPL